MSKNKKKKAPKAALAPAIREHTQAGKIAWWLILAMVFIVPLAMGKWLGISFVDTFDGVKVFVLRVGVMAILAAWIWDVVLNGGEIRYHRIYILIGVLLAWIAITTIVSISPATAFLGKYRRYDGAWSYFIYALLLFLTMQYAVTRARVRQLAQVFSASSAIVAAYGLLQAIPNPFRTTAEGVTGNWDFFDWGALPFEPLRSFSTFGNPNLLAGFLALSVFVNLGLLLSEKNPKLRRWYWVVLLMNSAVSITAFSRSLWVAVAVTLILFVFLLWRQRVRPEKQDYYFAGGLAAVVTTFIAFSLRSTDSVMNFWTRLQTIFEFDSGSGLTRFQIWQAAFSAIAERPIFGYGLDTFRLIFRHFAPAEYAQAAGFRSVADNAHNFPLQMATGIGIVGLILFYAVLFWVALIALRSIMRHMSTDVPIGDGNSGKKGNAIQANSILFIGIVCACISYCIHLFFGLSLPGVSFLLWIFMGVLLVPHAKTYVLSDRVTQAVWLKPLAVLLTVALLIPAVFATRFVMADSLYIRPAGLAAGGLNLVQDADTVDLVREIKDEARRTVRLNPYYERYYLDYFLISSNYAIANLRQGSPDAESLIAEAKDQADHLIAMSPWEYDSYLAVANFYMNIGQALGGEAGLSYIEEAADFMEEKLEFTPTGLALRTRYAEALALLGETDAARRELEYVIAHDSNHLSAAEFLQRLNENPREFMMLP